MKASIEVPDGYTLVRVSDTEYKVIKEEKKLPDTWDEFCEMNPVNDTEYHIGGEGIIYRCTIPGPRNQRFDRNWLPSKEKTEAILALCQLIQLRDCYNDGWVPDWSNEERYDCLYLEDGEWKFSLNSKIEEIFAFKSPELCRKFLENFIDLLDKIKPLYQ